jgi:hypothetical protein
MRKKKTITLFTTDDNPVISVLKGRHTHKEFEKANKAEGWEPAEWDKGSVSYKWLRKTGKSFAYSDVTDLKVQLYTVGQW